MQYEEWISPERLVSASRDFLAALRGDLARKADDDPGLSAFVGALGALDTSDQAPPGRAPYDHPNLRHLQPCLAKARGSEPLVSFTRRVAPLLNWKPVFQDDKITPVLANGMFAAQAAGLFGTFASEQLSVGFFLLMPGVHYPLHTHETAEIYYTLSGTLEVQHGIDGEPFDVGPGAYSITPPHRVHALRTGREPVLLMFVWEGTLACTNWWWSQDAEGNWLRTGWLKDDSGIWKMVGTEPVSPDAMHEAHA